MFDFAWSELALIAVVALVVIGPKDLPRVMRSAGFWVRKARAVAHEFQGSLEQMVRDAELDDIRQKVEKATSFNIKDEITRHIDPQGEIHKGLSDQVLQNPLADLPKAGTPGPSLPAPASEPAAAPPVPPRPSA
jgi:sec-independent protein translocase protein TatB